MQAWFGNENLFCIKFRTTRKGERGFPVFDFFLTVNSVGSCELHRIYAERA